MKTVIFDFGNVVAFFDHWKTLRRLVPYTDMPGQTMYDTVYVGQLEDDFESGRITERRFLEHFIEQCRLTCECEFLAAACADIFEPNPEVCDLIERLHGRVRLVLGSNTNPVHASHFVKQFDSILSRFDGLVLSHQVGARKPRREFLSSDDLADACVFLMKHYSDMEFVNIGTGEDVTIADFAAEVARVVGFKGKIVFDRSRPDGAPRKLLNVSKINRLGWSPKISLRDGLADAYADFLAGGGRFK